MSLNWKEINLVLGELDLPGSQIQGVVQSTFDVLGLRLHKKGGGPGQKGVTRLLLVALTTGACRLHETFRAFPKSEKPLRFAQFLNSRIVNGRIEEAVQLGDDRIVRLTVRRGENRLRLYVRLWSNAANLVVTDEEGVILDAMRRLPGKGEVTGGRYAPETGIAVKPAGGGRQYEVRQLPDTGAGNGGAGFNARIDAYYAEHGNALSLEALREQARRDCAGSTARLTAALEKLRAKESGFAGAERLKEYGDIILANLSRVNPGDEWLEAQNFFDPAGGVIRIKLDAEREPAAQAEVYYGQYGKAKKGLADVRREIEAGERQLAEVAEKLSQLTAEDNPLVLAKLLRAGGTGKTGGAKKPGAPAKDKKRPGLSFQCGDWLVIVGRDAEENDALLRRHVKGDDLWLHARDFPGAYVFIRRRPGKTFPLEIMLDAGNLAIFYSKGRNTAAGDLFYTRVKYLRRAKNAPKGLVIPTQEKNLHIKLDEARLRRLETCRIRE